MITTVNLLKFDNVSFKPSSTIPAIVNHISLGICQGDFVVIIGGNGSGKTSLLKLINRQYHHTQGNIIFNGNHIDHIHKKDLSRQIVTLTQSVQQSLFTALTIKENAELLTIYHQQAQHSSISKLQHYLKTFNYKLANALNKPLHLLSGGEQQILAFALYLRHQPLLLLLDEHTSALDPKTAAKIMAFTDKVIQKHQITCLMTTHNLDFALNYGNRLIAIKNGEVIYQAQGKEKQALKKSTLLQYCY